MKSVIAPQLATWEIVIRLGIAAGVGAALGLEREWRDHEAGVRTHMLVCLGSALFTLVSAYGFTDFRSVQWDPTRIAAQIVTGIGFLGAGTILRVGTGIRGLTTAANLWVAAGVGLAIGVGAYTMALFGAGIALFALGPVRIALKRTIRRRGRRRSPLYLDLDPAATATVVETAERLGAVVRRLETEPGDGGTRLTLWVDPAAPRLASELAAVEGVVRVSWED